MLKKFLIYEESRDDMLKELSERAVKLKEELVDFMEAYVYPNEKVYTEQLSNQENRWQIPPIMEELKSKAKNKGLWNLFLPDEQYGAGLSNYEYAHLCEIMGRSLIAPEVFN